jgi:phage FluMu gp28-like protein
MKMPGRKPEVRLAATAVVPVDLPVRRTPGPLIRLRSYQATVFADHTTKLQILHWSRQIGKSFTLANWAVKRLLDNPGRTVTVLSNSRANGQEFVLKCAEVCRALGSAWQAASNAAALDAAAMSDAERYALMREEVRITIRGKAGRIIVLAANPRTARGFSGDLIMDEFAFHEDSRAIWEAASPIISSNAGFLCRISSTGNGKDNMFYQMATGGKYAVLRIRRSDAWATGEVKIYSEVTGQPITPEQAREEAIDKAAYDQNYECSFLSDESQILLSHALIAEAEDPCSDARIEHQAWSAGTLARLAALPGPLFAGFDVARSKDFSVMCVLSRDMETLDVRAMLRMEKLRLPVQSAELLAIAALPAMRRIEVDMTGIGLGMVEFSRETSHGHKIHGVNFASSEAVGTRLRASGHRSQTAPVTELMALDLLAAMEGRRLRIPHDAELRDDLRKPEKIVGHTGRVSIAAARDAKTGHADHFWSIALAIRAANGAQTDGAFTAADLAAVRLGAPRTGYVFPRPRIRF